MSARSVLFHHRLVTVANRLSFIASGDVLFDYHL